MASSSTHPAPDASFTAPTRPRRTRKPGSRRKPTLTDDRAVTQRTLALMGLLVAALVGLVITIAYLSVSNG